MRNMHPLWQEEESSVPVNVREPSKNISRRPAALVGMLVVIGAGMLFFYGSDSLRGQLADIPNTLLIRITEDGFDPPRLEVEHGQTITIQNTADVPHIIESDTLCSDTGFCLLTGTLFNADTDTFTITPDMPPGTYEYFSVLSEDLTGEIVIMGEATDDFVEISDLIVSDFFQEDSPASPQAVAEPQQLPTNPYTVNGQRTHPFDDSGEPIPESFGDSGEYEPPIAAGNRPLRQPETGAGISAVLLGSVLGLFLVTRGAFARDAGKLCG